MGLEEWVVYLCLRYRLLIAKVWVHDKAENKV